MQQLDVAGIIHVAHRGYAVDVEDVGFGDVLVISANVAACEVLVVAQVDASSINSVGERGVAGEDFVGCHIRIYQLLLLKGITPQELHDPTIASSCRDHFHCFLWGT